MKQMANRSLMVMVGLMAALMVFSTSALASDPVHWSYEGEAGPAHWGELSPDFALCGAGAAQSPIDIPADATLNPADLGFAYQPSAVNIVNNGHTVQVNYDGGSTLKLDGQDYQLAQFHFHAGSENTHNGQQAPLEMHLVHKNAAGDLAVVGVWLDGGGSDNAAFAPVFSHLPATEGEPEAVAGETVNADSLLPADRSYYRFNGSLTTPPCSQNVKWIMESQPVQVSDAQIAAFTAIFDNNFRPVQPFNDRQFLVSAQMEMEPAMEPATLPVSGGEPWPIADLLAGLGGVFLVSGAGLFLYRRRVMAR